MLFCHLLLKVGGARFKKIQTLSSLYEILPSQKFLGFDDNRPSGCDEFSKEGGIRNSKFRTRNSRFGSLTRSVLCAKISQMSKATFQPKKARVGKVHGFLVRMASNGGQNVIKARRLKGRKRLTPKASA